MVWWVPLAAAATSAVGSLIGGERKNAAQISMAREQMAFQERMYKSRYQMQMDDMRAAGLNPILSYSQGPPGAPGGAQAQISDTVTPAVNSGLSAAMAAMDVKKREEEIGLIDEQRKNVSADTKLKESQRFKTDSESMFINESFGKLYADIDRTKAEASSAQASAEYRRLEVGRFEKFGESLVGRNWNSIEQIGRRIWNWTQEQREAVRRGWEAAGGAAKRLTE